MCCNKGWTRKEVSQGITTRDASAKEDLENNEDNWKKTSEDGSEDEAEEGAEEEEEEDSKAKPMLTVAKQDFEGYDCSSFWLLEKEVARIW